MKLDPQALKERLLAMRAKSMQYMKAIPKAAEAAMMPETEVSKARLVVCSMCDQWTGTTCKKCGCFTKLKVKIPEEKCPLGKW